MIKTRKVIFHKRTNEGTIKQISYRIPDKVIINRNEYNCDICTNTHKKESDMITCFIHRSCINKLHKCNALICPIYYISEEPKCEICYNTFCNYHLCKTMCLKCNNEFQIKILWYLKHTTIYIEELLRYILTFFSVPAIQYQF